MPNPYASRPPSAFWRRSVSGRGPTEVDPITSVPFVIRSTDRLATAGSCFAQHMSRVLQTQGIELLVTEQAPAHADDSYGVYPARFGNIYTVRQLRQLFERAYGLFAPADTAWLSPGGRFLDPFRPSIPANGFENPQALQQDRETHLLAVQRMFEESDVFVFTLGLTEAWISTLDGAVFPVAPGVVADELDPTAYRFHNFSVHEMERDLRWFIDQLRRINPAVRILLTVSPVAMVATYERRHVLVSNAYSKSALRVVAELVSTSMPDVSYFPSFEMITGAHTRSAFLSDDLRTVTPSGVAHVMGVFCKHYLAAAVEPHPAARLPDLVPNLDASLDARPDTFESAMRMRQQIICDEELADPAP